MKKMLRKKYFSYFSIMLLFLAFVQLVPLDMVSGQMLYCPLEETEHVLHICGQSSGLGQSAWIDLPCRLQPKLPVGYEDVMQKHQRLVKPANEQAMDCRQPEDAQQLIMERSRLISPKEDAVAHARYQLYELLAAIAAIRLFLCMLLRKVHCLVDAYKVTLWRNILYIHNIDGKKRERFSGIMVCLG